MLKKICCCCCSSSITVDTEYEEISVEGVWELNILGSSSSTSSSSSSDGGEEMNLELYVACEEASVDDDEYYRSYLPNVHLWPDRTQRRRRHRSTTRTIDCINKARTKANECIIAMKRTDYTEVISLYEEALDRCPLRHKYKIIKEYETFKDVYTLFSKDQQSALHVAHAYWKIACDTATSDVERRKDAYRLAIMCQPDTKLKTQWKAEYNVFLKK